MTGRTVESSIDQQFYHPIFIENGSSLSELAHIGP